MEEQNDEIIESEKVNNLGKIIIYGIFAAFVGSVSMCVISLILLVRTVSLAKIVYERNEELSKRYEAFDTKITNVETTINAAEENIEKNTLILTTTIEGQTQFVDELYKSILERNVISSSSSKVDPEEETNDKVDNESSKKDSTNYENLIDPYNGILDVEMKILVEMLNKLSEY